MDIRSFQNPPKEYREVPLWSWNDELDAEELRRQIRLMDEGGWGGFFMHTRVGLRTPYLGRQFLDCVRVSVDEARKRGMGAWIYDEDRWPSGFAGGLTVAANPDYRLQYLLCKVDDRPAFLAERIATFSARQVSGQLLDIRPEDEPDLSEDGSRVIQFYPQTMPLGSAWFNDYAYLSLLNPDAVQAFLESTYEAYADVVGEDFGSAVPGVFTDEPSISYHGRGVPDQPAIPWVKGFEERFEQRNGYDLLPQLPSLFFDVGEFHGVRYDYWRTVTELFVESFTRQVYDWCEEHNLAFTGHFMAEDTLTYQIEWIGAAMPHYPYEHIPGIDKLGRMINKRTGTVLTVKQLDSVVCQLGKPRAFCENYGCSGQDFAHTGRKWIGDWIYVLGINFNDPHIPLYSMRGERKRDFPQNLFYQQPWWPENGLIADYMGRLSYALSQGQRVVDILVIHPMGSAWALYRPGATHTAGQLDGPLNQLGLTLMENQRDFHFGDEMLMNPGEPCAGRVVADGEGPRLALGLMEYRVVIVPPGVTLAQNTVRLLCEFAAAGGVVLTMEPQPTLVNGRPTGDAVLPAAARRVTLEDIAEALDDVLPCDVCIPGRPKVWAHHRRESETDWYFLANTDVDAGGPARVQLRGTGRLEAWDLATGAIADVRSEVHDGGITEVVLDFPPAGSQLLVLHRDQPAVLIEATCEAPVLEVLLADRWQVELDGPNALTLDTAQVRIGEGSWSSPMHVLDAHSAVAQAGVGTAFALRFSLNVAVRPPDPVYLVVESPERFGITVNEQKVASADAGWWTDISFRKVDVSVALQAGHNEIILEGVFGRDTELESAYLIGDFGVAGRRLRDENRCSGQVFDRYASDFQITKAPQSVAAGAAADGLAIDLTRQGLPFFAGRAILRQTVNLSAFEGRVVLDIRNLRAAVAHVRVNGTCMGTVAWQPHRVDVTAGLAPGPNVIEVELVGTLRNLLGPHHMAGGDRDFTGPGAFRDRSQWTDDYILVPFGFDSAALIELKSG